MGVRVIAVAFFAMWGFYGVGTWGWVLVKGYNITFIEWFNPMKPYEWATNPGMVPPGKLMPTGQATSTTTAAKVQVA